MVNVMPHVPHNSNDNYVLVTAKKNYRGKELLSLNRFNNIGLYLMVSEFDISYPNSWYDLIKRKLSSQEKYTKEETKNWIK